jgi:hypothetical protein
MKHRSLGIRFVTSSIVLLLAACTAVATSAPASPADWMPPLFPGAVADQQLHANMTAVAATPEALDETACFCFGFPVQNAVFYAYRSDAGPQEIIEFYTAQMADQGWQEIAAGATETALPHKIWQYRETGSLVAYLMVTPMQDTSTLIYLSVAESLSLPEVGGE